MPSLFFSFLFKFQLFSLFFVTFLLFFDIH